MDERKTVKPLKMLPEILGEHFHPIKIKRKSQGRVHTGETCCSPEISASQKGFFWGCPVLLEAGSLRAAQVGSIADLQWKGLSLHSPRPSSIPYTGTQGPQATQGHHGCLQSLSWATRVLPLHLQATPGKLLSDAQLTQHHHFTWSPLCPTEPFINSFTRAHACCISTT